MTAGISPVARRVFDGWDWHENAAVAHDGGRVTGVIPGTAPEVDLLVPGLVDLQVNGGGGVQFNDTTTAAGLASICAAHRALGTTTILATLITDTAAKTSEALAACAEARAAGQAGLAGLHLEGPHLDPRRKGTHAEALVRPMGEPDLRRILAAGDSCGHLLVTLAPEAATPEQVARLVAEGVQVSLGHSDCSAETAATYFAAGASMATHLFNAMSQMGHRAPGLVGAALDAGAVSCGLIADGHHVSDVAMRVALRGKRGPGRVFLVSDAMAATGSDLSEITLNGRTIYRSDGRLTLADGTLAGADISMLDALRYCTAALAVPLDEALRMATLYPAEAAGLAGAGRLTKGARADFLALDRDLGVQGVWVGGLRSRNGAA
ncbi:N-acetylglucosamine-6-phosphate deacetylase [Salipiger mangrovisoli]|uniref:N-acetylglucosamine-6-phosphate deacetylase n=1 Tax=Salipiger mangrovisoli TaxID=2865933 RepID=A0ABR9X1J0_9RHOB|nr:N-acetylglucosamine-6-phosphate deacetylase [Salipiger mangrovisoli]MBE9637357.1 N-acetylglucosamine-6-phosphate deacetylase [Salipiger mangrovisoli]